MLIPIRLKRRHVILPIASVGVFSIVSDYHEVHLLRSQILLFLLEKEPLISVSINWLLAIPRILKFLYFEAFLF